MSGIAGIIHFDGRPIAPGLIERMTGAMAHRGPDGINHWVRGSVALGQCMLRTTPESLEEHQPLANEDESLVLVMDGRVDNWEDLRRELLGRGAVLRNRADAELVLRSYEAWGDECPDRIIGEYVFLIWDVRQQRLFGARDAAGTRHFYYHEGNGWFAFASEIRGVLALERIVPRLNESRLLDYLVVEFDRDDEIGTFYRGVSRLPAGHAMRVAEHGTRAWRYWNPGNLPATHFASLDECAEAFLDRLRVTVKCRLRSIGPVGAMLSGGLDSSSIVGLISKEFRGDLNQPLRTFSLIRHDRENCSDWRNIKEILDNDDWIEPTIVTSSVTSEACRSFFDGLHHLDEPFLANFSESLILDAVTAGGCNVALEGMGGDLLFYHPGNSLDVIFRTRMFSEIPLLLAACHRHGILKYGLKGLVWKSLHAVAPNGMRALYRRVRDRMEVAGGMPSSMEGSLLKLLHQQTARQFLAAKRARRRQGGEFLKHGNDQLRHAQNFVTGCLSFGHEMSAQRAFARGVELRSPFSDRRMIEFAVRMPVEGKLSIPWYKFPLRQALAGFVPEKVRWRRDLWQHPGWKFNERLILELAPDFRERVDFGPLAEIAKRWLNAQDIDRTLIEFHRNANFVLGFNLLVLAVLAKWLSARPRIVQP